MAVVNTGFDPTFGDPLRKFRAALAAKGIDTNIISGVRDQEDQRQLVANKNATLAGKPLPYPERGAVYDAAPVGSSAHQVGLAADVEPTNPADAAKMKAMASQFGLEMPNFGGTDPYHVQLQGWQQTAANQPPSTPWSQVTAGTNINSVPANVAPAPAAPAPAVPAPAAQPDQPPAAGLLAGGNVDGALSAAGSNPLVQAGMKTLGSGLAGGPPSSQGGQTQGQGQGQQMQVPQLQTNQAQIASMAPQLMAQLMAQQQQPANPLQRRQIPGLSLGGYGYG